MSFDKDYRNRKDRRRPYYGAKSFDRTCRPGGSCPACAANRTFGDTRQRVIAREKLEEYLSHREP